MLQKVLQLFEKKNHPLIAIDISATSVKILELSRKKRPQDKEKRLDDHRYCVERFGVVPLKEGAVVDKVIKDPQAVSAAIRAAMQKAQIGGKQKRQAIVALPDSFVITKWITMEDMTDDEIETQLAIEADKYIPYALEEVSMDFDVQRQTERESKYVDVLLVASRRENVDALVDVVSASGLTLKIVDVQSYVIERTCALLVEQFPNKGANQTIAIIDIGSVMTNLTVIHNMRTIFAREEVFGGEQLTREIQRHYGLSYAEAGLAKKQGNLPDDYVTEVLTPFKESAVLQVRRALQFFFSASDYTKVDLILLAGGTATINGLAELIQSQIGVPTALANPFFDMTIAPAVNPTALAKDSVSLMICCGLALRGFEYDAR